MTQIVVLCGGYGRRLAPAAPGMQKCLAPVAGHPFLAHVLDAAITPSVDHVLLLAGHQAAQVEQFARQQISLVKGPQIDVWCEKAPSGTVAALRTAADLLTETFLLLLGDVLPPADVDCLQELSSVGESTGADAVMMTAPAARSMDRGNVNADGAWITRYDKHTEGPLVDRGVRLLRKAALTGQHGDDDQTFFGALADRHRLAHRLVDRPIVEIGTPERWQQADAALRGRPVAASPTAFPARGGGLS